MPNPLKAFLSSDDVRDQNTVKTAWRPLVHEAAVGTCATAVLRTSPKSRKGYDMLISGINIWEEEKYQDHCVAMLEETPVIYDCLLRTRPERGPLPEPIRDILAMFLRTAQFFELNSDTLPNIEYPDSTTPHPGEMFFHWKRIKDIPRFSTDQKQKGHSQRCSEKILSEYRCF